MDITEVARASGVPASTLRFYEEKGLITSVGRHGLRRLFDANVLERLALIALGRTAGFTLDEIARMLGSGKRPRIDRQLLAAKADELDRSIKKMTAMRDGLRHAAECSAPSHLECPKFRRLMGLAAAGAIGGEDRKKPIRKRQVKKLGQQVESEELMSAETILLVYDKQCPACNYYCQLVRIRESVGQPELVDARDQSEIMDEITAAGLDIDQGMVLKMGNSLYYGSDAIHMLSLIGSKSGLFNRMNYWLFRSKSVSGVLYPILRFFRNLLLKILGKTKINNLHVEGNDRF